MPEDRRLAAIMFTDVVGYTKLMGIDEAKAVDILARNRSIHQSCIEKYNGMLIKEIGDGMLASFSLASEAVRCAIEIQKLCKEQNIPLKIGIHEGELIVDGKDIIGDAVNIAARLQEDTKEGCISISGKVYSDIKNRSDIHTKYIGDKSFKNVDEPIKVYKILCEREEEDQLSEDEKLKNAKGRSLYYIFSGIAVVVILILLIWKFIPHKDKVELEKSIAVLPFKNLSNDPNDQYLAEGMMDAILNHLYRIEDLSVRSRTSTEQFRDPDRSISEIGNALNANYILEGSFQKIGDKANLSIQLIIAETDEHIWAEDYNRDWSDVFNVQKEIAENVAEKIEVKITSEEKHLFEKIPTIDLTAYDYYLKGKEFQGLSNDEEDLRDAVTMYEKAVNIDSSFVLAWVGLAATLRTIYWFYYDRSEENQNSIKKCLDYALAISPDLKEVRLEEGVYYYQCKLNYQKALNILEPLNSKYSNDEEIYLWMGAVYRRMGKFRESFQYMDRSISINPSDWRYWYNAAYSLVVLREYKKAEKYFMQAIDLNPSYYTQHKDLLRIFVSTGQIKKAKEFLKNNPRIIDDPDIKLIHAYIEVLDKNYEKAIQITESLVEEAIQDENYYSSNHLHLGIIYHMMFNSKMAIKHFEAEKIFILSKMNEFKNDSRLYCSLGIAYAGLGMKEEAINTGHKALNLLSFLNDAHGGFFPEMNMVKILVMVGEYNDALTRLDRIMAQNGNITIELLKLDPFWDPVREMDKFKEIISNPEYQVNLSDS